MMRVTDSLRLDSLQANVQSSLTNLTQIQNEIATGKQLTALSDNPAGGAQALALNQALVDNAQYQTNADSAKAYLSASDSALSSASDLLVQAGQLATQGANGTENAADMASLTTQVDAIIRQMTQTANADLHGKYLFSGTQTHTAPFSSSAGTGSDPTPTYNGNAGSVTAALGKTDTMTLNQSGTATFGGAFTALQSLRNHLAAGNSAAVSGDIAALNAGRDTLSASRASLGAKMNETDAVKLRLSRAQTDYQTALSNITDVDLAQAYVQLQGAQNVYQASLATTSKAFQYSLADFLH